MKSVRSRRCLGFRAWKNGLLRPFYVPNDLGEVRDLFAAGEVVDAVSELLRLAQLGSKSAAATLGYVCLMDNKACAIDLSVALTICREAATRGDSFAQYVIAYTEYENKNYVEFQRWLNTSARQGFPPAVGDLARLLISGRRKVIPGKLALAVKLFKHAISRGHFISLLTFLEGCRTGKFGALPRMPGILAYATIKACMMPIVWLIPFSIHFFAYPAEETGPLFSRE
jgi:TPR repeat protein